MNEGPRKGPLIPTLPSLDLMLLHAPGGRRLHASPQDQISLPPAVGVLSRLQTGPCQASVPCSCLPALPGAVKAGQDPTSRLCRNIVRGWDTCTGLQHARSTPASRWDFMCPAAASLQQLSPPGAQSINRTPGSITTRPIAKQEASKGSELTPGGRRVRTVTELLGRNRWSRRGEPQIMSSPCGPTRCHAGACSPDHKYRRSAIHENLGKTPRPWPGRWFQSASKLPLSAALAHVP